MERIGTVARAGDEGRKERGNMAGMAMAMMVLAPLLGLLCMG